MKVFSRVSLKVLLKKFLMETVELDWNKIYLSFTEFDTLKAYTLLHILRVGFTKDVLQIISTLLSFN